MTTKTEGFLDEIFKLKNKDLYRAVEELIEEGSANGTYYTLLVLSSIIIAAGALLANAPILIGGMLVTPVLTPLLLIALGITTAKPRLLKRTALLMIKSFGLIMGVSFLAGIIFGVPSEAAFFDSTLFNNSLRAAFLYFMVAIVSGIAATFAWVRKEITNILPGISIAVSLVPPIAMVAIWLAAFDLERMRFFLLVFLFNLFGILLGSVIVLSLLKVYRTGGVIESKVDSAIAQEEALKREKAIKKATETIIERQSLDEKTEKIVAQKTEKTETVVPKEDVSETEMTQEDKQT